MNIKSLSQYLNEHITNSWYKDAAIDYGVTGKFIEAKTDGNDLIIVHEENGQIYITVIYWYTEYTPEQIYNIWMETEWQEAA